jgi:DNA polymerase III subunit epsilon
MREIVLDTETTGLDPNQGHRIIEIGCIELVNYMPSGKEFHRFINPQRDVPEDAQRVHGITNSFLADKPTFPEVADPFLEFIADAKLIIHNASFDIGFLNAELMQLARDPIPFDRVVDTLALARRKHPAGPNSLDALCKRYRIDLSERTKHGALLDSELLARVYMELIGGTQAALGLEEASRFGQAHGNGADISLRQRPTSLPPRITAEEEQAHRAFIDDISATALWRTYESRD